jgi:hypothetical protein
MCACHRIQHDQGSQHHDLSSRVVDAQTPLTPMLDFGAGVIFDDVLQ